MGGVNQFKKVKYICEIYQNKRFYFRQEFLRESHRWGEPRRISEETFLKRKNEGYEVEYRWINKLPVCIQRELEDISTLIDLALDTHDEQWFRELIQLRNSLLE